MHPDVLARTGRFFKDEHDATSWAGGAIQGGTQAAFFLFNGLMYLWVRSFPAPTI